MSGRTHDLIIVGGGLAGGLTALAVHQRCPDLQILLIEAGGAVGGNHRWSWFASDLGPQETALMECFSTASWDGYDVRFPAYSRSLHTPYLSLASTDFAAALARELPSGTILTDVRTSSLDRSGVTLASGERINAPVVIDCRGITQVDGLRGGWQTFMGRHFETEEPHGLTRPIIMDAAVEQHDGYRFVYSLPLGPRDIFVEDTYYTDAPAIDEAELARRIDHYCARQGWSGREVGRETGALPVITAGSFAQWQSRHRIDGVARAGARGGFVHPLTSYTLPIAAENALAIAYLFCKAGKFKPATAPFDGEAVASWIETRAKRHWRSTGFYRSLGRMLFGAAEPNQRYRIFERFYRLPEALIERFYAARSTRLDRARILCGKPPVPIPAAVRALSGSGSALAQDQAA